MDARAQRMARGPPISSNATRKPSPVLFSTMTAVRHDLTPHQSVVFIDERAPGHVAQGGGLGVESTMSVNSMVARIRSVNGERSPVDEPLHLVDHRRGVVAQEDLVGPGEEHQACARDGLRDVSARGPAGSFDVSLEVDDERGCRDGRQHGADVVASLLMWKMVTSWFWLVDASSTCPGGHRRTAGRTGCRSFPGPTRSGSALRDGQGRDRRTRSGSRQPPAGGPTCCTGSVARTGCAAA